MKYILVLTALFFSISLMAQQQTNPASQPEELGKVSWHRDYDQALSLSGKLDKPVLILFQEVPGCATCRNYGHNVLSHPLVVEAIESLFVPLVIYNNKGGKDKAILARYGEPSWNNPVVRIVNDSGKDLVKRVAGNYSASGLLESMMQVLQKRGSKVPGYLDLARQELSAYENRRLADRYYKMYCFWSGEAHLAKAEGVIVTEPGWMGGYEVVKVTYDASTIHEKQLDLHANIGSCKPIAEKPGYRQDKDLQYYLKQTDLKYLPLTPFQRTTINSALLSNTDIGQFLSPMQRKWLRAIKQGNISKKVRYTVHFEEAYWALLRNHIP